MSSGGSFGFSQSKSSSKSDTVDVTPYEYRNLRGQTALWLSDAMRGGPSYAGPFAAEMTGQERARLNDINAFAAAPPSGGISRGMLESTIQGRYLSPDSNPFLRDYAAAATRAINENASEQAMADRGTFARAGQRLPASSPFAYAEALRERGVANATSDAATRIYGQAYEGERGRQLQAAGQLTQQDMAEFSRQVEALQVSALPRLIQQLGYDRGLEEFRRRVELAAQAAGLSGQLSSVFGNRSRASSSSTSVQASGYGGYGGGGYGG